MQVSPLKILPAQHRSYYLFGEDRDALFEMAEHVLAEGDCDAIRLRVDITELGKIELESRSPGLFGSPACYALVRNAESATPKQAAHLLQLATTVRMANRLIVCAAGITWKKAIHKQMLAESLVVASDFRMPTQRDFQAWFAEQVQQAGLYITPDTLVMVAEQLCGLRTAARQLITRMKLYDNEEGIQFDIKLISELLGERAPDDLEDFCHAVAMKDSNALHLLRHLLLNQQVSDVQLFTWLSIRLQQLLMYQWYQAKGERSPIQAAKIFGVAKQHIPSEAKLWRAPELMLVMKKMTETEKLLKGASIESKQMVLERLTLSLLAVVEVA